MKDSTTPPPAEPTSVGKTRRSRWSTRLMASRGFQRWAARFPLTRGIVRSEGQAMFDLVAGFCHSQILLAFVRFELPQLLLQNEMTLEALSMHARTPQDRMRVLLSGAIALDLLRLRRNGYYALSRRGAALAGVPGLMGMIDHHDILYLDLADPVAFFRGEVETELADFWPYVFGAGGVNDPATAERYSQLMADSQVLVAEDTLALVDFGKANHVMDVGGGTGAFLTALGQAHPDLTLTLFDLPAVAQAAEARFRAANLAKTVDIVPGSFRDDPLPQGADMITLVRVLYDHADDTVAELLRKVFNALPAGGRIVVSEPMTGGRAPERAGDAYFALYCMAMRTGRARSASTISQLLEGVGFEKVSAPRARRPYITSVVEGVKPD